MGVEGIDCSSWQEQPGKQPSQIDWNAVKAAGKEFVIVRGGDGTFRDKRTEEYANNARSVGLHVEAYQFLRFNLTPAQMAGECERTVSRAQSPRIWLDVEDTDNLGAIPAPAGREAWLHEVEQRITGAGKGLYSGPWYESGRISFASFASLMPFWGAAYPLHNSESSGANLIAMGFQMPVMGGKSCDIWQISSGAYVPGITDNTCDQNYAREGFFEEDDMALTPQESAALLALTADIPDPLQRPGVKFTRLDYIVAVLSSMDLHGHFSGARTAGPGAGIVPATATAFGRIEAKLASGGGGAIDYKALAAALAADPAFATQLKAAVSAAVAEHIT